MFMQVASVRMYSGMGMHYQLHGLCSCTIHFHVCNKLAAIALWSAVNELCSCTYTQCLAVGEAPCIVSAKAFIVNLYVVWYTAINTLNNSTDSMQHAIMWVAAFNRPVLACEVRILSG